MEGEEEPRMLSVRRKRDREREGGGGESRRSRREPDLVA